MTITASRIHPRKRRHQGEVNGRWVIEADADFDHPAGTLVADAAPGEPDDMTFTAANGQRYWDVPSRSQWTPRQGHEITILAASRHDLGGLIETRRLLEGGHQVRVEFADGKPAIEYTPADLAAVLSKLIVSV